MDQGHFIEIEDDTVEDATARALAELGIARDQARVEVLSEPSRGIFGLGSRKARVRVTNTAVAAAMPPAPAPVGDDAPPARSTRRRDDDDEMPPAPPLDDETVEQARAALERMIALAGLPSAVLGSNDGDHATLDIVDDAGGLLIGRKGQTLDALEYLVTRMLGRDSARTVHITVDCQGYRGRRQTALEDLARRMGDEARQRRRPVRLEDLTPRERRIVHLVLKNEPGLTTRSTGDGHLRTLIISPTSGRGGRDEV